MATDLGNATVWLFSGGTSTSPHPSDTWSWNGAAWTLHTPATAPAGRYGHAFVWDIGRSRGVMFGGRTSAGTVAETWEWDGTAWTQTAPPASPQARYEHAMAYDLVRGRTVLFSGGSMPADTWEFDGTTWTQIATATAPGARRGHAMAFHTASGRTVLFGGNPGGGETWTFDGVDWVQETPAQSPPSRYYFSMCEDFGRSRVVLFSGRPSYPVDTWEWDGDAWLQRLPQTSPPGLSATGMAYSPANGGPLLFGGIVLTGPTRFDRTWTFAATSAEYTAFGAGCAGTAGVPELRAVGAPYVGTSFRVRIANLPTAAFALLALGLSDRTWALGALPFPMAAFGMPGCDLLVSPDATLGMVAVGDTASATVAVPNSPALAGLVLFHQGLVLDPGANAAGAVVSNGARLFVAAP